jgi:hypothetical protein
MTGDVKPAQPNTVPSNGQGPKITNCADEQDAVIPPIQIIAPEGTAANQGPALMDILANPEAVKAITEMGTKWMETYARVTAPKTKFSAWRLAGILVIILAIIGSASYLTFVGKMDSGSITFLFGAIVGSLITFVSKLELGE